MTELLPPNLQFDDLILREQFDYNGKTWRCYLLVPQEHLEDLFRVRSTISPDEAYKKEPEFWNRLSEATRDFYRDYLRTQMALPLSGNRHQWFQWKDFEKLETAYRIFKSGSNERMRLSIVAREPAR